MTSLVLLLVGSAFSNALIWLVVAPRVFPAPEAVKPTIRRTETPAAGTRYIDLQAHGAEPFFGHEVVATLAGGPMDGERRAMPAFVIGLLDPGGRGEYVREDRDGCVILHWKRRVA